VFRVHLEISWLRLCALLNVSENGNAQQIAPADLLDDFNGQA
jgi:hypothetical protein